MDFPLKKRFDEETMTIEGRERAAEQEQTRHDLPQAPPDFDPDAVQADGGANSDDANNDFMGCHT